MNGEQIEERFDQFVDLLFQVFDGKAVGGLKSLVRLPQYGEPQLGVSHVLLEHAVDRRQDDQPHSLVPDLHRQRVLEDRIIFHQPLDGPAGRLEALNVVVADLDELFARNHGAPI